MFGCYGFVFTANNHVNAEFWWMEQMSLFFFPQCHHWAYVVQHVDIFDLDLKYGKTQTKCNGKHRYFGDPNNYAKE
jgi:hypothetical protein